MPHRLDLLVFNWLDRKNPQAGGAETNLHEVFGRLAARGHRVTVVVSSWPGAPARETVDGMDIHRCGSPYTFPLAARSYYAATWPDRRFDVVVEDLNKVPLASPLWVREPVVLLVHHLFGASAFAAATPLVALLTVLLERILLPLYSSRPIIAVSDSSAAEVQRRARHRGGVHVIHNGAPCPVAPEPSDALGTPDRTADFLFVGRLQPYKRVDLCIRAIALLAADDARARLIIVGRGPEEHRLRSLVRRLGVGDRVEFRGFVGDDEKFTLMARARANVITSVKEGWGMSILEAAAQGTPSIASNSPGLCDAVRDGTTGVLVPHGDVRALAAAMKGLLDDHARARTLGDAARAHARTFSWDAAADAFEDLLLRTAHQ